MIVRPCSLFAPTRLLSILACKKCHGRFWPIWPEMTAFGRKWPLLLAWGVKEYLSQLKEEIDRKSLIWLVKTKPWQAMENGMD
jgi:hypothetical protein